MKKIIKVKTDKLFTILTTEVSDFAEEWGKSGLVNVYTTHTTTSLRVLENELLHHADVRFWLDKYLPKFEEQPQAVNLKLPKLKKVGAAAPKKIQLPKLKKV